MKAGTLPHRWIGVIGFALLIAACGSDPQPAQTTRVADVSPTASRTATPSPTDTPTPT